MTTLILQTAGRILVPLSLAFGVFIYFKGHQTPGGGFVGGLVLAVALVIARMAYGGDIGSSRMKTIHRMMIAVGLFFALLTGTAALFWGLPFFTSNNGYLPLPSLDGTTDMGKFHWASVMLFDLGVMLTVAGVVVGMIEALMKELRS